MATYYGARIREYRDGLIVIRQGKWSLKVTRLKERPFTLQAPSQGNMVRTIKESPACCVRYQFWCRNDLIFDVVSDQASFEQVDGAVGK